MDRREDAGVEQLLILAIGLGAGLLYGAFGAGGAAFATPVLALAGVPGALAVASPLPARLPVSIAGVRGHVRAGTLDRRVAGLAVAGGMPGALLGGAASGLLDGSMLLLLSGILLLAVGARVLLPDPVGHADRCEARRHRSAVVVGLAFAVGLVTGLLANGGGFLLVPAFVLVLGLSTGTASGTSLLVAGALSVPTLLVHWSLGHIDWSVAALFALGSVPGTLVGMQLLDRVPTTTSRRAFGILLVVFATYFLLR
jgi:uncharacterized membrane protein YfcA